jgi:hypothetical protein
MFRRKIFKNHNINPRPDVDVFVFDNGEERSLVNLNGTIPVDYRGNSYNIPVCFWLLHDYPNSAPMAYVKPTQVWEQLFQLEFAPNPRGELCTLGVSIHLIVHPRESTQFIV